MRSFDVADEQLIESTYLTATGQSQYRKHCRTRASGGHQELLNRAFRFSSIPARRLSDSGDFQEIRPRIFAFQSLLKIPEIKIGRIEIRFHVRPSQRHRKGCFVPPSHRIRRHHGLPEAIAKGVEIDAIASRLDGMFDCEILKGSIAPQSLLECPRELQYLVRTYWSLAGSAQKRECPGCRKFWRTNPASKCPAPASPAAISARRIR